MYDYEIDSQERTIIQTFKGVMTREIVLRSLSVLVADSEFDNSFHVITDLRAIINQIPQNELKLLAQQVVSALPAEDRKSAFVVDSPRNSAFAILFGQILSKDREFQIFSTMEAAKKWVRTQSKRPTNGY